MIRFLIFLYFLGCYSLWAQPTHPPLDEEAIYKTEIVKNWADALKNPDKVYRLDISTQGLQEIPAEISKLRNLQVLYCANNQLSTLPAEIGKLTNLQFIDCKRNKITNLPAEIGNLVNLKSFYCEENALVTLPATVGNWVKLRTLILYKNQLTALPAEIGNLVNLEELMCMNNHIKALPATMGKLRSIKIFAFADNLVSALPEEFGDMGDGQTYVMPDFSGNPIQTLPAKMAEWRNETLFEGTMNQVKNITDEWIKSQKYDEALQLAMQMRNIRAKRNNPEYLAESLVVVAIALKGQKQFEKAVAYSEMIHKIAKQWHGKQKYPDNNRSTYNFKYVKERGKESTKDIPKKALDAQKLAQAELELGKELQELMKE